MRPELTFWDHITLSLALLFVVIFTIVKIKRLLSSPSGGCGNCSGSACSAPLTKKRLECKHDIHKVSVSSIQKNSVLKKGKENESSA